MAWFQVVRGPLKIYYTILRTSNFNRFELQNRIIVYRLRIRNSLLSFHSSTGNK